MIVIPDDDKSAEPTDFRVAIVHAVRERRYEDALELLQRAHDEHPRQAEITASIHAIKSHLQQRYLRMLGGGTRVLRASDAAAERDVDEHIVLRLIDDRSTIDDIVRGSSLGRFRTLRALVSLYAGSLEALTVSLPPPLPAPPARAMTEERFARALRHIAAGRFDAAAHDIEEIVHDDPENPLLQVSLREVRALMGES